MLKDQGFVLESFRKTKIKSLKFIFQKIKSDKTLNSLIQTMYPGYTKVATEVS